MAFGAWAGGKATKAVAFPLFQLVHAEPLCEGQKNGRNAGYTGAFIISILLWSSALLQPGTGTTDAILGAFFHEQLAQQGASWFTQAQLSTTMNSYWRSGRK